LDGGRELGLDGLLARACDLYKADPPMDALREFFRARLDVLLQDRGHAYDTVDAVLSASFEKVSTLPGRLSALESFRESDAFDAAYPALNRALRILPDGPHANGSPDETLLREPAERELHEAVDNDALAAMELDALAKGLASLQPRIDAFFDAVLVMDKDEAVRDNRLALLSVIGRHTLRLGDITKLVIAGQ
jgi:glycyl-tRNA synthetase beta subunit